MQDLDRYRLLGHYETPRFEYGDVVYCERLGEVEIVGLSDGKIPWPKGRRRGVSKAALILFAGLAEAVRRESNIAICYWWGVTPQTVWKWRKALDVSPTTEGTSRLRSDYAQEDVIVQARQKAYAKARDPQRRHKIADAKRGKPRPRHVIEAMRAGRIGKKQSPETRARMSASHKRRGTIPPKAGRLWTAEEDNAVRTLSPKEAAEKTGRTLGAITSRRHRLGVPDGRRRAQRTANQKAVGE